MPNPFQTMSACTYYGRCLLTTNSTIMYCRQIVGHDLKGIEQIIQVLNLSNRTEATHGQTNTLSHNGGFTNTGIRYTRFSVFRLHSFKALIYVPDFTAILSEDHGLWIQFKELIKIVSDNYTGIYLLCFVILCWGRG